VTQALLDGDHARYENTGSSGTITPSQRAQRAPISVKRKAQIMAAVAERAGGGKEGPKLVRVNEIIEQASRRHQKDHEGTTDPRVHQPLLRFVNIEGAADVGL